MDEQKYLIRYYDSDACETKYEYDLNEKEAEAKLRELYLNGGTYEKDVHLYKTEELTPKIKIKF